MSLSENVDAAAETLHLHPTVLKLALLSDVVLGLPEALTFEGLAALGLPLGAIIGVITFALQVRRDGIFWALVKAAIVGGAVAAPTPAATVLGTVGASFMRGVLPPPSE